MYQVGINKGIILRCTDYQISRLVYVGLFIYLLFVCQSHFDKEIKKPAYTSCVLTVNFNPIYKELITR